METRTILRGDLVTAWHETIEMRYHTQEIDSERALQAHFCAALLKQFQGKKRTRRLFIEPTIRFSNGLKTRKPDILICDHKAIIGIVELKYKPRARASYTKDLDTLDMMATDHTDISVSNGRYLGPMKDGRTYQLAHDAVLCWAAVYKGRRISNPAFLDAEVGKSFLALHAITSAGEDAKIFPLSKYKNAA